MTLRGWGDVNIKIQWSIEGVRVDTTLGTVKKIALNGVPYIQARAPKQQNDGEVLALALTESTERWNWIVSDSLRGASSLLKRERSCTWQLDSSV